VISFMPTTGSWLSSSCSLLPTLGSGPSWLWFSGAWSMLPLAAPGEVPSAGNTENVSGWVDNGLIWI
jgi:hypothetical protein